MKWGLALSGGGAFGIANGGVLEVLDRENIRPDCLSGSSMGAIVGALYALGHPPSVIRDLCDALRLTNVARLSKAPFKDGLHGGLLRQCLEEHLAPLLGDARIGDCRIPFVCIAGRVRTPIQWHRIIESDFADYARTCVEKHVFPPSTRLIDAIMASSAIPVIFSPVTIGNDIFVDLLAFGAIPSRTLREIHQPAVVIGTDTAPRHAFLQSILPRGARTFMQAGIESLQESRDACDLVIEPIIQTQPYRFDRATEIYETGIQAAETKLPEIRKLLTSH